MFVALRLSSRTPPFVLPFLLKCSHGDTQRFSYCTEARLSYLVAQPGNSFSLDSPSSLTSRTHIFYRSGPTFRCHEGVINYFNLVEWEFSLGLKEVKWRSYKFYRIRVAKILSDDCSLFNRGRS